MILPPRIKLLFCFIICSHLTTHLKAQQFAKKDYYLVDSLEVKKLSLVDITLIDSCLKLYHLATHDTSRVRALTGIVEGSWDDNVWPKYNRFTYELIKSSLNKKHTIATKRYLLSALAGTINNIGFDLKNHGEIDKALKYYHESLKIKEKLGDKKGVAVGINNIAIILDDQGEVEKALEYYKKCLAIQEEIKDTIGMARSYSNIGLVYYQGEDINKAIQLCHKSRKLQEKVNDKKGLANSLNNLAAIYSKQGNIEGSLEYYLKSLAMEEEVGNLQGIAWASNNVGRSYSALGQPQKSIPYLKRSLKLGRELQVPILIQNAANTFSEVYGKLNRGMEALAMYKLYVSTKDSLNDVETQKETAKQQLKYEYEKQKTLDDAEHEKQLALKQEEKEKQQIITITTVIGLLLLAVFLIIIFNRLKITRKQNVVIEEQKSEIVDSITYAKRIQEAILPSQEAMDESFNTYFIYYRPKDIVAGDFYWLYKNKDEVIFAVADCTGHGVPGAMMSVICNNALDRATREYQLTDPGKILDKTRDIVVDQLNKSSKNLTITNIKDGMDISLCNLNTNTGELLFAGAYNPLWVLRKGTDQMEVFKANRQPIGRTDSPEPFQTHQTTLNLGDTIYLFTDGYADQFGGVKGKKMMSKVFRNVLIANQSKDMSDQLLSLEQHFNDWKKDLEQIDDVCVLGIQY